MEVKEVLEKVRNQELSIQEAQEYLKSLPYEDMGFAKLDHHRKLRSGFGEVIYCAGKTKEQVARIFQAMADKETDVLGTRASREQFEAVRELLPDVDILRWAGFCGSGETKKSRREWLPSAPAAPRICRWPRRLL